MTTCGGCTETYTGPTCPRCTTRAIQLPPLPRQAADAAPAPVAHAQPEAFPSSAPLPGPAVAPPPVGQQWAPEPQSWGQQWAPQPQQWAPAPQAWPAPPQPAPHDGPQLHWAPGPDVAAVPVAPTPPPPAAAEPKRAEYGEARFVGDARPIAGIPLSRIFNAACWIIAGIAMLVISAQPTIPTVWPLIFGLAGIAYGAKILFTRSAYWVSSTVYVIAIGAVVAMFVSIGH